MARYIDVDKLLEWIEYGHIKQQHIDVRDGETEDFVPAPDLINKINELATDAKNTTVQSKPEDWQVGDTINDLNHQSSTLSLSDVQKISDQAFTKLYQKYKIYL